MSEISGITDMLTAQETTTRVTSNDDLSREEFFEIMTLQLQQQDPTSPMESQDFLNQFR